MNRRNFALTIAATIATTIATRAGAAALGPASLHAAVILPESAAGWSSARAAALLKGARFRVQGPDDATLELVGIETYQDDDRQYFASFRARNGPISEGLYRLHGPAGPVELYLQPRGGVEHLLEAVVCHARG